MGAAGSKTQRLEKALGSSFPGDEHFYGLENFGNTCYCNSVLQASAACALSAASPSAGPACPRTHHDAPTSLVQALYYCKPLRERCIDFQQACAANGSDEDDLLSCLCELFLSISTQRRRCGVHAPRRFITKLRAENELFNNQMHQDAHEFLNYLLNEAAELLEKREKAKARPNAGGGGESSAAGSSSDGEGGGGSGTKPRPYRAKTWIHSIFEGVLTNETRCLCCETVTSRDECFLDLSLEIEQNSSVSACMRKFSGNEPLRDSNKFFCDTCCSLQEANKCMRIKRLPNVLALHLKRFKYIEQLQRFKKLSYRISFPHELKLTNTSDATDNPDRLYSLFAVVVHVGSGPNHGHYISLVRSHTHWLLFDDDSVELIDEANIQSCFGSSVDTAANTDTGYILFYQCDDASWDSSADPPEVVAAAVGAAAAAAAAPPPTRGKGSRAAS